MHRILRNHRVVSTVLLVLATRILWAGGPTDPELQALASEVFRWRAVTQPCMPDDLPRVERPAGWVPDHSPEAYRRMAGVAREFQGRLETMPRTGWTRADSVDFLLVRSVVERARWEGEVLALHRRNPDFYVQQTLGALWELLILRPPMTPPRVEQILIRLRSIPATAGHARVNLDRPVQAFARMAITNLESVGSRLRATVDALPCSPEARPALLSAADSASKALEEYGRWLSSKLPGMDAEFHVGREAYLGFLRRVALVPMTPEEMTLLGNAEFHRAATLEAAETRRFDSLAPLPVFRTLREQIEQTVKDEHAIREFLTERRLLTIPQEMRHYTNVATPAYLRPLSDVGELDDFTAPQRLTEDAVRYIPEPSPSLSFFPRSMAQDPRPIIIHEGIPGHYFQLARSWRHEDPVRRQYIDSGPNEGWGFYVEELLLQVGLFDNDRPQTRAVIYRFMRLRALRVEADVRLALGEWDIPRAARFLAAAVPMDLADAEREAAFFASTPGQAMTYQIGKLQIMRFLSDARSVLETRFDLRDFHDRLAYNGNVPVALQRWEALGIADEVSILW
jgi:uncharacterized protein (DUF885 family)